MIQKNIEDLSRFLNSSIITMYTLRRGNLIPPWLSLVAMDLPYIFGGAVLTETIFSWPGMGRQFWKAALDQDYPVLMTMVMIVSIAVVVFNLLADIVYAILDPRIRYE